MADTTVSHTIFFIASVIVAASLAGAFIGISQDMASHINDRGDDIKDLADSDLLILNDPAMMPYEAGVLTIYVKNLSERILGQTVDVFVDGTPYTNYTAESQSGGATWPPYNVLTIKFAAALADGDHHLRVVLPNGASAELLFRI